MNWSETGRSALDAIRTRRMRSALTMLGILIGIAAVMLTVGLGQGAENQVSSQINALGTNVLTISPGSSTSSAGVRGGFGSASTLTEADANALENRSGFLFLHVEIAVACHSKGSAREHIVAPEHAFHLRLDQLMQHNEIVPAVIAR